MTKPGEGDLKFALPEDISSDLVHRFSYTAMAALFGIDCVHVEEKYARQAARCAFDEADRLERELSRFVENSDISRINHLSTGQGVRVSHRTMECLEIARSLYLETGGAFLLSPSHVPPYRRLRNARFGMLPANPHPDPVRRVPLLARLLPIAL